MKDRPWCRKLQSVKHHLTGRRSRIVKIAAAVCFAAVLGLVIVGYAMPREVTVIVDDSLTTVSTSYETTARQVGKFLEEHDIPFDAGQDEMDAVVEDDIENGMEIRIRKAFDVTVTADGKETSLRILPMRVEEALAKADITYDEDDIIEPSLETVLKKGMDITIQRVEIKKTSRTVAIDYETEERWDNSVPMGDVQVVQKGRKGKIKETFEITYVDGKEVSRELVKSKTLRKKRNKVIGWGRKIAAGKPDGLKYKKKITNVRAVSYNFKGNPRGSYGLPCTYGTVAVDPNVIPLGSRLYIEGYGYAIANDVGSAIKGNTVDLYMERFDQCMLWGARWVTVYVL